jgi:hypothetical protein
MDKLAKIRNQELICRERALSDPDRRAFWLMKAEEWAQRAPDEIALQFSEDRFTDTDSQKGLGESHLRRGGDCIGGVEARKAWRRADRTQRSGFEREVFCSTILRV